MEWPPEKLVKLARMVKEKCMSIQNGEFVAKRTLRTYEDILEDIDQKIYERLGPLGFERADRDWQLDSDVEYPLYRQSRTHLWFDTAQGRVTRITKEQAEKVLVLGIP